MPRRVSLRWSKGFKELEKALKKGATPAQLKKHLGRATLRAAGVAAGHIKSTIQAGNYEVNADLTVDLKNSTKPLVGRSGQLQQAIRHEMVTDLSAFVGVRRDNAKYKIAKTVHDGKSIAVSDRMRNMFEILWKKSMGANVELTGRAAELWALKSYGWLPLSPDTEHIVIPPRRFIEDSFRDPALKKQVQAFWEMGFRSLFAELAAGVKGGKGG
jgi:hypothetical protein